MNVTRHLLLAATLLLSAAITAPCQAHSISLVSDPWPVGPVGHNANDFVQHPDGWFYGTSANGGCYGYGMIFRLSEVGTLEPLVHFTGNRGGNKGKSPRGLTLGVDGSFYGVTNQGGANGYGTVFKMSTAGALTTLVEFTGNGTSARGSYPNDGLTQGADGSFYGMTSSGAAGNRGTVFKLTRAGVLTTLVEFTGNGANNKGRNPKGSLTLVADGTFYGMTASGGAGDYGTVFKVTTSGVLTTLVEFTHNGASNKGSYPQGSLTLAADGDFYGTTGYGGASGAGTVFKMTQAGLLTTLVEFTNNGASNKGLNPAGDLSLGADGNFYGTTPYGGAYNGGTVFKMTSSGSLTTIVEFPYDQAADKGDSPARSLTEGSDGNFYAMTSGGGTGDRGTVFRMTPTGALNTLVHFTGDGASNIGRNLKGSLTLASDGNFYGMTPRGGTSDKGTVYKMTTAGVLTTLLEFTGNVGPNKGAYPYGSLTQGLDGDFYGMTSWGGNSNKGTIFKMTPAGALTTLVELTNSAGSNNRGTNPRGSLTLGADNNFYGTTSLGGESGYGTVFKMTSAGELTTLVEFTGSGGNNTGDSPTDSLTLGVDGTFYGTTSRGGASNSGTVFRITPSGLLTTLVEFNGWEMGGVPSGGLTLGTDGNFYGMTAYGGVSDYGTVFKMTPHGALSTLVVFKRNGTDSNGAYPFGSLTLGADGSFYGMTAYGGVSDYGTVFKMTPSGVLTTLVELGTATTGVASGGSSGDGHFIQGADGDLYGLTAVGGHNGGGIVFKLDFVDSNDTPILVSPASSTATRNPISVSFILAEDARPGSLKLTFGPTQLTLATSQENAGSHSFTFSPSNPTASPEIASGHAIPDGTYTVTLSYQDALANETLTLATDVVIDQVRPFLNLPFASFSHREDAVTVKVPVTLDQAFGSAFTVPFTVGGSAVTGDATVSASPLRFAANQTTAFISITLKDDLVVEGDDTLTLTPGSPSTDGVRVVSPSVFTLTILEDDVLPVISPDLVSRIVAVGDAVTFASGVTGSAPLTLKWKKGSATLLGETGTSLVLPPATLANAAAYTFSASNQRGGDSSTADLAVVDRSAAIIRANAGTSPKLSVAAKGNRLSYQWRDASGDLSPSNPKYAGVTSAILTIKNATVADTGLYICRVTAPGGTLDSGDRFLQVPSLKPSANTPALPDVVIHNAFSHQLTFDTDPTRAPTQFLCTGLPKGLRCDPASGLISGKPTETGDFTVTVTMSNAADTADTVQDTFSVLAYPAGAVGKYLGVIGRNVKANADLGGRIDFTTTPLGSYTGTLKLGSSTLKLSGTLATPPTMAGHPGVTLTLARSRQLPVILKLDLDPATNDLTGSVYEQGETGSDNLIGWRNTWTSTAPAQQGAQSFKIDPAATGPQGYGFGSIAVSATGVTTLKGQTADGGVVTSSGLLGPSGEVLVFAPMLGNKASLLGTLGIGLDHSINSTLSWQKTAATKPREYAPFGPLTVTVTGGLYVTETPVLGLTDTGADNAEFLFSEAGVPSSTNPNVAVYLNTANKPKLSATNPGSVKLTSFNASTGTFTGQFTLKDAPAAPRTVKFQGQLVPTESRGYGYFLLPQLAAPSPILSGKVVLE
jgi:uncharacterized repeat protein (TIGR03803 family)